MDKSVGYLLVGVTLMMAAMDGALAALILAGIAGGGSYLILTGAGNQRGVLHKLPDRIYAHIEKQMMDAVDAAPEKEREALRRQVFKKLETLKQVQCSDETWNKRLAAILSAGVFANPVVGLGILTYMVQKTTGGWDMMSTPLFRDKVPYKPSENLKKKLLGACGT